MILPVCQPSVISFLHHANSLSVSETDPRSRHHLINSFLQLYVGMGGEGNIDFYSCDGMYPRYPFIDGAWVATPTLRALGADLVTQTCAILDRGAYLDALLDEFHISAHRAYQQAHFPHQNLIYGYDKDAEHFLAMGYGRQFRYGALSIPFDEFRLALADHLGMSIISRNDLPEYNNSEAFSPVKICTYLDDFVHARNSFLSFRPPAGLFGVATYVHAVSLVEQRNGAMLDIRPWSIFCEHKEKLLALHDYLTEEKGVPLPAQVTQQLRQLRDEFLELRNYLIEAVIANTTVKIGALQRNLAMITSNETTLIRALISATNTCQ